MAVNLSQEVADHLGPLLQEVVFPLFVHTDVDLNRRFGYFGSEE